MPVLEKPLVFERGDKLYLVAGVSPITPSEQEVEEYAFASDLRKMAPNPHIAWFGGHYVEADQPNLNGAMWTAGDLHIASMTPMFMPVTVMHDPRSAVGLIANLALRVPERDNVPRAKIDTALAVWRHRFPEIVEEAEHNYRQGSLMQSMECLAPDYECATCGSRFHKLPEGVERANWCSHLKEAAVEGRAPTRILRNVVFTGTGFIFGSRGAEGADPLAHLETFQEEVAEFHQRVHRDTASTRRKRKMDDITIPKSEYDELRSRPTKDDLAAANERAETAEKSVETLEAEKAKLQTEKDELGQKVTEAEETARAAKLGDERLAELGKGFTAKLGDKTKTRLTEQARSLSDDEWSARLEELEEAYDVKRDDGAEEGDEAARRRDAGTFTQEEVARSNAGRADRNGGSERAAEPSATERRSVVAGLVKPRKS